MQSELAELKPPGRERGPRAEAGGQKRSKVVEMAIGLLVDRMSWEDQATRGSLLRFQSGEGLGGKVFL